VTLDVDFKVMEMPSMKCVQLTRDLLAIAKFLYILVYACKHVSVISDQLMKCSKILLLILLQHLRSAGISCRWSDDV